MNQEIKALKKITTEIKQPMTCIIGGSKISTKINIIKNLNQNLKILYSLAAWQIIFCNIRVLELENQLREKNCESIIESIFSLATKYDCNIIFPEDVLLEKIFMIKL